MSRIEQIITEIEDYIDSCKFQPLSNTKILVNKEEIGTASSHSGGDQEISEDHQQPGCDSAGGTFPGRRDGSRGDRPDQ